MQSIAIIHHLSSSGGTVFCKCLATQPSVVLLSEMHPLIGLSAPTFLPFDPLAHLVLTYPELSPGPRAMNAIFRDRLRPVAKACAEAGKVLVLRDHSHSDYLTGKAPLPRLAVTLSGEYQLRRLVTLRNPIDAYLSMKASGFDTHLSGFDDYCRRAIRFLDDHVGLPIWTYENFTTDPKGTIGDVCSYLGIDFDPERLLSFGEVHLTGDSGRRPSDIRELERREMPSGFAEEIANSEAFRTLAARFGFA